MRTPPHMDTVPKTKPQVIEVIRYFRRWDYDHNQISSHGGITALCKLDYRTMTMKIFPAFCSVKENFDKAIGRDWAEFNAFHNIGFVMPFDRDMSILDNLVTAYYAKTIKGTCMKSVDMFKHLEKYIQDEI